MEAFWGKSLFEARSKMNFLCAGNNFQPNFIPDNFQLPAAGTRVPGFWWTDSNSIVVVVEVYIQDCLFS